MLTVGTKVRLVEQAEVAYSPEVGSEGEVISVGVLVGVQWNGGYKKGWPRPGGEIPQPADHWVPRYGPSDNGQWSTKPEFVEKIGELAEVTKEGLHPHQADVLLNLLIASALFIDEGL